jgi:hypothetical protein
MMKISLGSLTFMSWTCPYVHKNLSTNMVDNIHQIMVLNPQKDNPQGMSRNQHRYTATSHPLVDEKDL